MIGESAAAGWTGRETSSWRARWILIAVLCLLAIARTAIAAALSGLACVPFAVALFVLPLSYAVPATRALWTRHRFWLLAGQAVLTYLPFLLFGSGWVPGVSGLLAGLVLLTLPPRVSWPVSATLLVVEDALRIGPVGLLPAASAAVWIATAFVTNAFALFGLARLVDLVAELNATRDGLAAAAVAEERFRAAEKLRAALGEHLASVAARTEAALQALDDDDDQAQAREETASAGVLARQAIADVRAVTRAYWEPVPQRPVPPAGTVVAPRLARTVLVVVIGAFAVQNLNNVITFHASPAVAGSAVMVTAATVVLQLHHSGLWRAGHPPRAWPWTLALQASLNYVLYPAFHWAALIFTAFLAGSVLLLIPGRWAWSAYAALVASYTVLDMKPFGGNSALVAVYHSALAAAVGLMVYGLSRLAQLAVQVDALRGELARMAVLHERLRVARDVHDLLGLGLSAIALKTDLVSRLIGRDDARTRTELEELQRLCTTARTEVRLVADDSHHLSLDGEMASARTVLASAGIQVRTQLHTDPPIRAQTDPPVPALVDALLATVLREAVTNILRHSSARHCTIETAIGSGVFRLSVANDGAATPEGGTGRTGHGLANLTARLEASGGRLDCRQTDGFHLIAEIPLPAPAP
jgi:two-component system sensor histidine kinase DesK